MCTIHSLRGAPSASCMSRAKKRVSYYSLYVLYIYVWTIHSILCTLHSCWGTLSASCMSRAKERESFFYMYCIYTYNDTFYYIKKGQYYSSSVLYIHILSCILLYNEINLHSCCRTQSASCMSRAKQRVSITLYMYIYIRIIIHFIMCTYVYLALLLGDSVGILHVTCQKEGKYYSIYELCIIYIPITIHFII